ncbi:hypothetical protein [Intrasporangium sp. YIM S08009]|uniref:hypothetical protein n=1 Tax=Intrasporangium zincisolvens TaxID=3080018 RepID=UPI002B05FD43|nr:hypothetical protein [Intrasporangium sp. YIM S08009]
MCRVVSEQRLPPQGGLPPAQQPEESTSDAVVEIACDESGFSGTNLLDAATPLFTHASLDLRIDEAADLTDTLRSGVRWSLHEVKSGPVLRGPDARAALAWLLERLGGRAHVHVVDKELFLASRVVDVLLVEPSYLAGTRLVAGDRPASLALFRAGRRHAEPWLAFLDALGALLRTKRRHRPDADIVDAFLLARDDLLGALRAGSTVASTAVELLAALRRERVADVAARIADGDRSVPPPLEPLLPALAETVLFWSAGTRRVRVVHDEQSALTADRLRRLQDALARAMPESPSPLTGLVTVDSRDDPRVQVADLLAGVARRSPDVLADPLLRPYLSPTSLVDPLHRPGGDAHDRSGPSVGADR